MVSGFQISDLRLIKGPHVSTRKKYQKSLIRHRVLGVLNVTMVIDRVLAPSDDCSAIEPGMSLTLERIEALAPDQASLAAARKLLKPASWPTLAEGEGLVWGECQGSGATPYRVVVNIEWSSKKPHLVSC
jgi:hypothetical protein